MIHSYHLLIIKKTYPETNIEYLTKIFSARINQRTLSTYFLLNFRITKGINKFKNKHSW